MGSTIFPAPGSNVNYNVGNFTARSGKSAGYTHFNTENNTVEVYAGTGCTYDKSRDAFIAPKANCHDEETLDEETCRWVCSNAEHTTLPE